MAEETNKLMGIFGVRNDKNRGILIETLELLESKVCYFKYQDQPLNNHCPEVQTIIRAANVQRSRKLHIDITAFSYEYFRASDQTVMFRETKLTSEYDRIEKVYTMRLKKEAGIAKRKITIAENRQKNMDEKNMKVTTMLEAAEMKYQAERTRRFNELFGEPQASNAVNRVIT